jgi:predicted adenylyl cyclase CyaB
MARNVEIKASIEDIELTRRLVSKLSDRGPETLQQTDTFFHVDSGRLKLREFDDGRAELIYYNRPNQPGPKESQYQREAVSDGTAMRELLSRTLGIHGTFRKKRLVYWAGRTRVHVDEVEGLGNFLELEVVLREQEPIESGVKEAHQLMERLEIESASLLPVAYIDLLHKGPEATQT